jgi:hypothetical protein
MEANNQSLDSVLVSNDQTLEYQHQTSSQATSSQETTSQATSSQETTFQQTASQQSNTRQPVNYDRIDLSVVVFDRIFYRNKGTLSQIVKSLDDMANRLTEPENDYQKELYPYICKECKKVVETYTDLVNLIDSNDNNVFGFYLNGPHNNGQRKATTTTHERKSYGVSEYKETLKSINDRLRHIKLDCQRRVHQSINKQPIVGPRVSNDILNRLIEFSDQYHKHIDQYMADWNGFIAQFRTTNNVQQNNVQQNNVQQNNVQQNNVQQNNVQQNNVQQNNVQQNNVQQNNVQQNNVQQNDLNNCSSKSDGQPTFTTTIEMLEPNLQSNCT